MDYREKAQLFFNDQKSMKEAVQSFINLFMDIYNDEGKAEKELLSKCVQQMFKKYYYSALIPESVFTPASIVNTLFQRKFGKEFSVLPTIKIKFSGKKIKEITQDISCFTENNHPMVKDMVYLLKTAGSGLLMDTSGIIAEKEYSKFKNHILIFDRHYLNILCLAAIEAGYLEITHTAQSIVGKATKKAEDYLNMDDKLKLKDLINTVIKLCSKYLTQSFPMLKKEFTYEAIYNMLKKPREASKILTGIYEKFGFEMDILSEIFETTFYSNLEPDSKDFEMLLKVFEFQSCFDMYFLTPLGYYLQLIQPIYPEPYYMYGEVDTLLSYIDDFHFARNILFMSSPEYDLTVLGEKLINNGRKSIRNQIIEADEDDDSLYDTVLSSQDYDEEDAYDYGYVSNNYYYEDKDLDEKEDELESKKEDDFDIDEIKKFINEILYSRMPEFPVKKKTAKVLDFNERKKAILKNK